MQDKLYYPFNYYHASVYTVAVYGSFAPMIVKGNLVLREYFEDAAKTKPDIAHNNEYMRDALFFETNKVIRMKMSETYNNHREVIEHPLPFLGSIYRLIYNIDEIPSRRNDDRIFLATRDPLARGVGVIVKYDKDRLTWLSRREAEEIKEIIRRLM